jgi:hypothetical protein
MESGLKKYKTIRYVSKTVKNIYQVCKLDEMGGFLGH